MAGSSGSSREFKNVDEGSAGSSTPSSENQLGLEEGDQESGASEKQLDNVKDTRNWTLVSPSSNKLRARYYHAATVIGRKMLVVGGDSDVGMLNDVQQLHLGKLTWSTLGARGIHPQTKLSQHLPPCRGHSLIAWGKKLLLVAGETEPHNEYISVWSFDLEKECWSRVETKGELPIEVLHIPPSEHTQLKSPTTLEKGTSGGAKEQAKGGGLRDTMIAVDFGVIPLERKFQTIEKTVIMDDSKETAQEKNELWKLDKEVMETWGGNSSTRSKLDHGDIERQADLDAEEKASVSELKASYEKKLAVALQRQAALEVQLELVTAAKDEAEQSLTSTIKGRQKTEQRLAIALKDIDVLKKNLEAAEIAQEESNNLANTVHTENLQLDHELAFLKAVLVDTEKELHTTRSVLSGERSRAFQLQVELFELKQTLQNNSQKTSDK